MQEMQEKLSIVETKSVGRTRRSNNNHHVVPLGILIVLSTVYLMIAGVQINYNHYFKSGVDALEITTSIEGNQVEKIYHRMQRNIVQPLCKKIEVFTVSAANESTAGAESSNRTRMKATKRSDAGRTSNNKKKDNTKKTNTAEPIIYLFALVFIYLLLKAASDINQHYKTQNKGDKRLRRCSLQSYAQKEQRSAHQDRRASKVSPLQSRHHLFSETRSVSLDRYKFEHATQRTTKPLGPMGNQQPRIHPPPVLEPRTSRRLSVPISINYQTINVCHQPALVHPPELTRRGSVISLGSQTDMATLTAQPADMKRRVRMINRH